MLNMRVERNLFEFLWRAWICRMEKLISHDIYVFFCHNKSLYFLCVLEKRYRMRLVECNETEAE